MKFLSYLVLSVLVAVLVGGALLIGIVWNGFVLSTLWGWFMVPAFGLPAFGVIKAAGISLVVRYLTYQLDTKDFTEDDGKTSEEKLKKGLYTLSFAIIYPLFALGVGWVVHLFL